QLRLQHLHFSLRHIALVSERGDDEAYENGQQDNDNAVVANKTAQEVEHGDDDPLVHIFYKGEDTGAQRDNIFQANIKRPQCFIMVGTIIDLQRVGKIVGTVVGNFHHGKGLPYNIAALRHFGVDVRTSQRLFPGNKGDIEELLLYAQPLYLAVQLFMAGTLQGEIIVLVVVH